MTHAAEQIAKEVESVLTGLPTTGADVYADWVYAIERVPALVVRTTADSVEDDSGTQSDTEFRSLVIDVVAVVKDRNTRSALNAIRAEVESAMYADRTLGDRIFELRLIDAEYTYDDEAERPVGSLTLSFALLYRVDARFPDTLIH